MLQRSNGSRIGLLATTHWNLARYSDLKTAGEELFMSRFSKWESYDVSRVALVLDSSKAPAISLLALRREVKGPMKA